MSTLLRLTQNGALVYHSTPEQCAASSSRHQVFSFHADCLKATRDNGIPGTFDALMRETLEVLTSKHRTDECEHCKCTNRVLNVYLSSPIKRGYVIDLSKGYPVPTIEFLCDPCHRTAKFKADGFDQVNPN